MATMQIGSYTGHTTVHRGPTRAVAVAVAVAYP